MSSFRLWLAQIGVPVPGWTGETITGTHHVYTAVLNKDHRLRNSKLWI